MKGRAREENEPLHAVVCYQLATARAGSGCSWDSLTCRAQVLRPSAAFLCALAGNWIGSEAVETNLHPHGKPTSLQVTVGHAIPHC